MIRLTTKRGRNSSSGTYSFEYIEDLEGETNNTLSAMSALMLTLS